MQIKNMNTTSMEKESTVVPSKNKEKALFETGQYNAIKKTRYNNIAI